MSMQQTYPSELLERAVGALSKLPAVGRKSALRLALHLLKQDEAEVTELAEALVRLRTEIKHCAVCHNISDTDVCRICSDASRKGEQICVVENVRDVMAIENTQQYNGLYHVLGGIISPMNGIGPTDLEIASLVERVANGGVEEVILALSPNMEGDTTAFYIFRKLADYDVKITTIARGVAVGDELEFADEVTLGRSIRNRVAFATLKQN
ncbi:MAG: recombination mediator RecR [Bacteroidales bacterium]|nr:recombination mediator RecR [Bacteroidales bacterium]MDY4512363.1 recombination mediator RecR [Paludibacteraceae bacterium]